MANDITAFFERLTAASGEFNAALVGELNALDAVYLNLSPEAARKGQTLRIPFPDLGAFVDQAANDWVLEDVTIPFTDIAFGERPGKGILIDDFSQTLTSSNIIDLILAPMWMRAMEYANGRIFDQVTAANFNTYPAIQCAPGTVAIGDVRLAWNTLVRNKIPLKSMGSGSILYHPDVHANTLTDTNWYQESLVSAVIAKDTRQNVAQGEANVAFRFNRRFDQQAKTSTTALAGTVAVSSSSSPASVVGTTTTFTTAAPVGSWINFGSDTVNQYQVKTVTDDTHLTLAQNYAGTTNASTTATRTTYLGVAMNRNAICLAVRPMPMSNGEGITSRLIKLGPLPVRAQMSYQHLKDGFMFTMDYVMVAKVIRPAFGIILQS